LTKNKFVQCCVLNFAIISIQNVENVSLVDAIFNRANDVMGIEGLYLQNIG